jgi:hypothetical protein
MAQTTLFCLSACQNLLWLDGVFKTVKPLKWVAIRQSLATLCRIKRALSFSPLAGLPYSRGRLWPGKVRWGNPLACIGRDLVW